jgi:hypothetical protein
MKNLTKSKLVIICSVLMLVNVFLAIITFNLDDSTYQNLDGSEVQPHSLELITRVLSGIVISVPIVCFLIGLLVALFIDKHLPYVQRTVKGFLLTLAIVYGLYASMGLVKLITY